MCKKYRQKRLKNIDTNVKKYRQKRLTNIDKNV